MLRISPLNSAPLVAVLSCDNVYDLLPGKPDFDEGLYRLGRLCKQGHEWHGSGMSLRYRNGNGHCVTCQEAARNAKRTKKLSREQKLSPEAIKELSQYLAVNTDSPSGLVWVKSPSTAVRAGSNAGVSVGASRYGITLDGTYYSAAAVVLVLTGRMPCKGEVATRIDPSGPWSDPSNLTWSSRGKARSVNARARYAKWLNKAFADFGISQSEIPSGCCIRPLCRRGHKWKGFDISLCRGPRCIECEKERKRSANYLEARAGWIARNRERLSESAKRRQREKMSDPLFRELKKLRTRTSQAKIRAERGRQSRAKGLEQLQLPPGVHLDRISAKICRDLVAEGYPLDADVLLPIATGERYQIEKELWVLRKALEDSGRTPTVAQLVDQEQKRYWTENPEERQRAIRESRRLYHLWKHKTDPEYRAYHRQKSKRRKAILRQSIGVQIKGRQIRNRFAEFNHACAYCGVTGQDLHIEHVVPISRGGTHTLGNIVPACKGCNFNKAASDVEIWYRRQPFFEESRWRKIKQVLGWHKSSTGQLSLI